MNAYNNHRSSELGIIESKSFFSRIKKLFSRKKKKYKVSSDTVNKIYRCNSYDDTCSNSNTSNQQSINSNNSKSSSNSLDLIREDNNKYEVLLPYQRFLKNR
jgi:hypothetical protein